MLTKFFFTFFATFIISIMLAYFFMSTTYEKSLEAKYYYTIGDYDRSYELSVESFKLDKYNKMAYTLMAQSKISIDYVKYIDQAKDFMLTVDQISKNASIEKRDKVRMKMMSEIVIGSYKKLSPSVMIDDNLKKDASFYFNEFTKLHEKLEKYD